VNIPTSKADRDCLRKRGYWTESAAKQVIDQAKFTDSPLKPVRAYKCTHCPRWHLSSRPDRYAK
jgi:hypothetical protein